MPDRHDWPAIEVPLPIQIDLPPPPSVNRTRKLDKAGLRRLHHWHDRSDAQVTYQWAQAKLKIRSRPYMPGQFGIRIQVNEKLKIDLDNIAKAVIDYCKRIELVTDDSKKYMRHVEIDWSDKLPKDCGARVLITPWPTTS